MAIPSARLSRIAPTMYPLPVVQVANPPGTIAVTAYMNGAVAQVDRVSAVTQWWTESELEHEIRWMRGRRGEASDGGHARHGRADVRGPGNGSGAGTRIRGTEHAVRSAHSRQTTRFRNSSCPRRARGVGGRAPFACGSSASRSHCSSWSPCAGVRHRIVCTPAVACHRGRRAGHLVVVVLAVVDSHDGDIDERRAPREVHREGHAPISRTSRINKNLNRLVVTEPSRPDCAPLHGRWARAVSR